MKGVKLFLTALTIITMTATTFAETKVSKAIIHQTNENQVTVKAELCDLDQMRVEITNENGDIVFQDQLTSSKGIANKTYDFSETKVGGYFVTVYCNDKVLETTTIGNGQVSQADNYYFVLN